MLISRQRRQHPSSEKHQLYELPLRTSTSTSQLPTPIPAETEVATLSHSPSSTSASSPANSSFDYSESSEYYMPRGFPHNQSACDFPFGSRSASTQPSPNSVSELNDGAGTRPAPSWTVQNNAAHLVTQPRFRLQEQQFHKRNSSDSTATSGGPRSPFTPVSAPSHPYIVDPESQAFQSQHLENFDHQSFPSVTSFPKPLPASHAIFSDSLLFSPQFQNFSPQYADNQPLWEQAMRHAMTQQQHPQQEGARKAQRMSQSQGRSGALSGDGVGVPNTHNHSRAAMERNRLPNLGRTMSDIYQDELYNPEEPTVPAPTSKPSTPTLNFEGNRLLPRNTVFSERLQAAGQGHLSARSASPTTTISREKSPFRPSSQYAAEGYPQSASPVSRLGSAAQMREQQKAEAGARAIAQQTQPRAVENQKTVSPKEVSLEYEPEDDAGAPLMGSVQSPPQSNARSQRPSGLQQELTRPEEEQAYDALAQLRRESSSTFASGSTSFQQNGAPRVPQQYPFVAKQRRQASNVPGSHQSELKFSQHSLSMESTKSEQHSDSESSSHASSPDTDVQRPAHTTADTGTYTCTYHGCTQRFETPSKLQKHKREGHRQGTPTSAGIDGKGTQAGPHKCERVNPTTGKPCNSIFSRPYDLTRHEDTIHNARKQKVRCQLCVEEKTFSRNDALTRHMRVVHPKVDFPGKIKRGRV
ncbi:MAG: hypothetical protein LQ340_004878 [Diploschistes diacapsis]|nr:MAG: hypothetical protein LQ340_004878 [Diploschistes diacapsis]